MADKSPIQVIIADEHRLFRQGLCRILESNGAFEVVGQAENGHEAVAMARNVQPDVILMDVQLPGLDGVKTVSVITTECPHTRVIVLTACCEDQLLFDAINAGVRGFLLKDIDAQQLIIAINVVYSGGALIDPLIAGKVLDEFRRLRCLSGNDADMKDDLTRSEIAVLRLVATGLNNVEVAARLGLAPSTVSNRLHHIFQKLYVDNRTQAALYALRKGWVKLD